MSELPSTFVKEFHDEELCRLMEYRKLGKTGLDVSKVAVGGGTLSDFYGNLDVDEAIQTIRKAVKSGINYIDTAPYYGQGRSEEVLGMALKTVPRQAYYIATKVGRYTKDYSTMFDFSAKRTRESVERSLKLLNLDNVDVIQIHDVEFADSTKDTIMTECLPELEKIVQEGKARFIGLTGYPVSKLKEFLERAPNRFSVVLSYARYTLMDDTLLSYLDYFQKLNLGIVCASGHALGLLTNAGPQSWHPASDEQKELCRKASEICKASNVELGKLAMYYFTQLNGVSTFLVGMQTRHLLDINLNAVLHGLTEKERDVLKVLRETIFTKSIDWEGIELQHYWTIIGAKKI